MSRETNVFCAHIQNSPQIVLDVLFHAQSCCHKLSTATFSRYNLLNLPLVLQVMVSIPPVDLNTRGVFLGKCNL